MLLRHIVNIEHFLLLSSPESSLLLSSGRLSLLSLKYDLIFGRKNTKALYNPWKMRVVMICHGEREVIVTNVSACGVKAVK